MPRVKRGFKRRRRVKKVKSRVSGFSLGLRTQYRRAVEAATRADVYAYRDRKVRKRDFRSLWITRINAAIRVFGISYSDFVNYLKKSNVLINRKMLADIAVFDPVGFESIVKEVKPKNK